MKVPIKGNATKENAYWISPDRYVIPVPVKHIDVILQNPEKFDLTDQYIRKIYKKYKEPYGHEGYAREDIMNSLLEIGWTRLRYLTREDTWVIQVVNISKTNSALTGWAQAVRKYFKYSGVQILDNSANLLWQGDMAGLAGGDLVSKEFDKERNYSSLATMYHEEVNQNIAPLTFLESIDNYKIEKSFLDKLSEHIENDTKDVTEK